MIRRFLLTLALLPVILLVLLALVVGTPFGTKMALDLVDLAVEPLSFEYRGGQLNSGLQLADIHFAMPGVEFGAKELSTAWRLTCLLDKNLCIDQIAIDGITLAVDTSALPAGEETPPAPLRPKQADGYRGLGLPISIDGKGIDITNVDVQLDDIHVKAESFSTELALADTKLVVEHLKLAGIDVVLPASAEETATAATDPAEQETTAEKTATASATEQNTAPATEPDPATAEASAPLPQSITDIFANLPTVELPLAIIIQQASITNSRAQIADQEHILDHFSVLGSWQHTVLSLPTIELQHNWLAAQGHVWIDLSNQYTVDTKLSGEIKDQPFMPEIAGQKFELVAQNSLTDLALTLSTDGVIAADLAGQFGLGLPDLPFQVSLQTKAVQWPLTGKADYQANAFSLAASGDFHQQRATVSGTVQALDLPQAKLDVDVAHGDSQLIIKRVLLDSEVGQAELNGKLGYGEQFNWQAALTTTDLNIQKLFPDVPLQLNGKTETQGRYIPKEKGGDEWAVSLNNADISGSFQGTPLTLSGSIELDHTWQGKADNLLLSANQTELALNGNIVNGQWQLQGQAQAKDLGLWLPELKGRVNADLKLTGPVESPRLDVDLRTHQAGYDVYTSDQVQLLASYWPNQQHKTELALNVNALDLAGEKIGPVKLGVKGDLLRQDVDLAVEGDYSTKLALGGNYQPDDQTWSGALLNTELNTPFGQWQNDVPVQIDFNNKTQALVLGAHCWQGQGNKLCLQDPALLGPKGAATLTLTAWLKPALKPFMPKGIELKGRVNAKADVSWQPNTLPYVKLALEQSNGSFTLQAEDEQTHTLTWKQIELAADLNQNGLALKLITSLSDSDRIELNAQIDPKPPYALSGKFTTSDINLAPYVTWLPTFSQADGHLNGEIRLGGNLNAPKLNGQLALKDGQFATIVNPTKVTDTQIALNFNQHKLSVEGGFNMGPGRANLSGDLNWANGLEGEINFTGDRLELLYPPMVTLEASPDLQITLGTDAIKVRGGIRIPEGQVSLAALPPGAVSVSSDVVFIDQTQTAASSSSTPLDLDIQIAIDDAFAINALGLTGVLGGDLSIRQTAKQSMQGYGELELLNGEYKAFGQNLQIRLGTVNFTGPLDRPALNIEAVRVIESEDVVAGIRVTGTPVTPQLTLFSNPAMEQQEVLSYITRGKGVDSSSGGSSELFASAALGLGISSTQGVFSSIGETIGVKGLALNTESEGDDTQVTLSGYLGKNLFVKYGVGVFGESVNELTVRYYLLQNLWLEAVSAVSEAAQQSLILYYSFDID